MRRRQRATVPQSRRIAYSLRMARIDILQKAAVTAIDYRCSSGPDEAVFPEVHVRHSLSYVRKGTFGCTCRGRVLDLVPGALFIGHPGDEYICTHSHHRGGDECLSFQFDADVVAELAPDAAWRAGMVPPSAELMILGERGQMAAERGCGMALDEIGLLLGAQFARLTGANRQRQRALRPAQRCKAIELALWMDAHTAERFDLPRLARAAGLSSYHFLRVFSRVLGVTPHQYLLRARLRAAARRLLADDSEVTRIALDVGFNDVSNFVRTFGRAAGMSPAKFRRLRNRDSNIFQAPAAACS